jgi:hypothetical protein
LMVGEEGVWARAPEPEQEKPRHWRRRSPTESGGERQIEATVERVAPTSSERVHEAVARGLRVLRGKRKDTDMRASIYRLKCITSVLN